MFSSKRHEPKTGPHCSKKQMRRSHNAQIPRLHPLSVEAALSVELQSILDPESVPMKYFYRRQNDTKCQAYQHTRHNRHYVVAVVTQSG